MYEIEIAKKYAILKYWLVTISDYIDIDLFSFMNCLLLLSIVNWTVAFLVVKYVTEVETKQIRHMYVA